VIAPDAWPPAISSLLNIAGVRATVANMTRTTDVADVLVVGAGPVGLLSALELTRHGARPRVVERAAAPSSHSKACVIWPRAAELLRAAGVLETLAAKAEPLNGIRIEAYGRQLGRLDFECHVDEPAPGGLLVGQQTTERVLAEALAEAGVVVERGREVTDVRQTGEEVAVTLADGGRLRSRYLIGCDGAASSVRNALGLAYEGRSYTDHKTVQTDARMRASFTMATGEVRFWLHDQGFLGCLPMPGGTTRLFALVPDDDPSDDRPPTLDEMRDVVTRVTGDPCVELSEPQWLSHARFQHRRAPSFRLARCFLAGDAAHIVPPILGQGMNTGLQDAANLAFKLAWVLRGRAPESLLNSYGQEREQIADLIIHHTDVAYRHLSEPSMLQRFAARTAGPSVVERERVQRAAREQLTGLAHRYKRSNALDPAGARDQLVGARAPDGLLMDGSLRPRRVHELVAGDDMTGLVFCGLRREDLGPARVAVRGLSADDRVSARVVVGWSPQPSELGDDLLVDYDGVVQRAYDADPGDVLVIRPDGHVGHRGSIADLSRTRTYLARVAGGSRDGAARAA
jgi:3-(3-hydroxy-phenyl)propionate hydroxylase